MNNIIANTNSIILLYDTFKEFRQLTPKERSGRDTFKRHLEHILIMQRTYWKQRATIRNIKFSEANIKFFQAKATIKHINNLIIVLKDDNGIEHNDYHTKAAILFTTFKKRMGISQATEATFTKKELDDVVKHMPSNKSLRLDGFSATFLKACWHIIAPDFNKLIADFHAGKVNMQSINYSFITLILKRTHSFTWWL